MVVKLRNAEDIGHNLPNVHSRVQGGRDVATGYIVCCDTRGRRGMYDRDIIGSYIYS